MNQFNNYKSLINTTCILLNIFMKKSFKLNLKKLDGEKFREAEHRWIQVIQRGLGEDWKKKFRRLGVEKDNEGFIVVGRRLSEWFGRNGEVKTRLLIPHDNRFTYLYVKMIHEEDHSIDATIAKLRQIYWIPRLVKVVKNIKDKCVKCKKVDKRIIGQSMGPLPIDRLLPNPPFSVCVIDMFSPIIIRDNVKKRCRGKCYGVLFNCITCRTVYIDIADGYDTDSFLFCLRRFIAIRGYPQKIIFDRGSQLTSASKELKVGIGERYRLLEKKKDWSGSSLNQQMHLGRMDAVNP